MHLKCILLVCLWYFIGSAMSKSIVQDDAKKVICSWGTWAYYRPEGGQFGLNNIDPTLCTHIIYSFAGLDLDGCSIINQDPDLDDEIGLLRDFPTLKEANPDLKVMIAVGGYNEGSANFSAMASDEDCRNQFIQSVLVFLEKYNLDGLDVDWEYPAQNGGEPEDKDNYISLICGLRDAFDQNYTLSVTAGPSRSDIITSYDVSKMSLCVDFINLNTFDFHSSIDGKTGYNSPIRSDDFKSVSASLVAWMVFGAPANKLILGIPLYGWTFTLQDAQQNGVGAPTSGPGPAGPYTGQEGYLSYNEICEFYNGFQFVYDENALVPYSFNDTTWISYEDPESVELKAAIAAKLELGGVWVWSIEDDDFSNSCGEGSYPLLNAIRTGLDSKTRKSSSEITAVQEAVEFLKTNLAAAGFVRPQEQSTEETEFQVTPESPDVAKRFFETASVEASNTSKVGSSTDFSAATKLTAKKLLSDELKVQSQSQQYKTPVTKRARDGTTKIICNWVSSTYNRPGAGQFSLTNVDATLCTHVVYSFAGLRQENCSITNNDTRLDDDIGLLKDLWTLKETNPNLIVMVSVGSWRIGSTAFSAIAGDEDCRNTFIRSVVIFLEKYSLDGLDVYWHYPGFEGGKPEDKENFISLICGLRDVFKDKQITLSATVGATRTIMETSYDIPSLNECLDFINLNTFDYYGSWNSYTGHNSPLRSETSYLNVEDSVLFWLQAGASADKLVLGIPAYGRTYTLQDSDQTDVGAPASGPGPAGPYSGQAGMLSFKEICQLPDSEYSCKWADIADAVYCYSSTTWVSLDNKFSVKKKAEFAANNDLGGVWIWSIEDDDFNSECGDGNYPLLNAVRNALYSTASKNTSKPMAVQKANSPMETARTEAAFGELARETIETSSSKRIVRDEAKKVVCNWASWAYGEPKGGQFGLSDIDPTLCTHIIYSFADIDGCSIANADPDLDDDIGLLKNLSTLKEANPELQIMISIGGGSDTAANYSSMASDEDCRNQFIQSVPVFLEKYSLDGLDVDWEYPAQEGGKPEDKTNYINLICGLYDAFEQNYTLFATVGASQSEILTSYYVRNMSECVDFINLNTFAFHTFLDNKTGYNAPMNSEDFQSVTAGLVAWLLAGAPREKIILGIPAFGMTYTLEDAEQNTVGAPTSGPGPAGPYTDIDGYLTYKEVCQFYSEFQTEWDFEAGVPYSFNDTTWISFDNAESVEMKATFATAADLGGVWIWSIDQDDFDGSCGDGKYPLLNAIRTGLHVDPNMISNSPRLIAVQRAVQLLESSLAAASLETNFAPEEITSPFSEPEVSGVKIQGKVQDDIKKVICYWGTWAYYRPEGGQFGLSNIDPNLCTHIIYSFAGLDTCSIKTLDPNLDDDKGFLKDLWTLKEANPDLKVSIAIGGWNEGSEKYSTMASNEDCRNQFIQSVLAFLKNYKLDGFDVDWEYPAQRGGRPEDKVNYISLLCGLHDAFQQRFLLSAAVGAPQSAIDASYDVPSMDKCLDFINLMTYDFHGSWDGQTGHNAPLQSADSLLDIDASVGAWRQAGASVNKLILGIPLYGHTYTLQDPQQTGIGAPTSGPGPAGQYTRQAGMVGYNEICEFYKDYQTQRDDTAAVPYSFSGTTWISYDDPQSVEMKASYAAGLDLGGVLIWSIETDDFSNRCGGGKFPMLNAIHRGIDPQRVAEQESSRNSATEDFITDDTTETPPTNFAIEAADTPPVQALISEQVPNVKATSFNRIGFKRSLKTVHKQASSNRRCVTGDLSANTSDSTKFFVCLDGEKLEVNCPINTTWDVEGKYCSL